MKRRVPLPGSRAWWPWLAEQVTTHPGRASLAALLLLVPPMLGLAPMRLVNDALAELPPDAPSLAGYDALSRHFPPGEISPTVVVIDTDRDVTEGEAFRAIGDLSRNLKRLDVVASVRSAAMPTDGVPPEVTEVEGAADLLDQVGDFENDLAQAADGARRLAEGLAEVEAGLAQIDDRLPELRRGLTEGRDGVREMRAGVGDLRRGIEELRAGVAAFDGGLAELGDGLAEARDGAARLRDDVAAPAEAAIRAAWDALAEDFTVGRADPAYRRALESVGETYGRLTGEDPRTGQQVEPGYRGLTAALDELADGIGEAVHGVGELRDGARQLDQGLGQVHAGLGELDGGLARLQAGLADAVPGVAELQTGIGELHEGAGALRAGAEELARGLGEGAAAIRDTGFEELLPGAQAGDGPFVLTPALLEVPGVREDLDYFLTEDNTRTRLLVGLAVSPFSPEGLDAVREVEEVTNFSLQGSPLDDATVRVTGVSAFLVDLDETAADDLPLIVVSVLLGVFLVLVILLRALVAPAYMVLTTLVSYGAALGLTALVFQGLLGDAGLAWWIPPFLFVILVAVGADYTIYLVSRIREEAETRPTRVAVARATAATGGVITSAGVILAGTFFALVFADLRAVAQMGFATAAGILLDTFIVRSLLVPSLATAFGRLNWWPSARGRSGVQPRR